MDNATIEMKNIKKLIDKYENVCIDIAKEFTRKYFYEEDFGEFEKYFFNYTHAIGNEYDGVWEINEWFFSIQDMKTSLELNSSYNVLIEWYEKSLEDYGKKDPLPNLKNYIKYPELRS